MEELKLLVDMVANLPQMALWVIAAFFAYKVIVIGSVYGVIRLGIDRLHSWLITPKHELQEIRASVDGVAIGGALEPLMVQIRRIVGRGSRVGVYAHIDDVQWLREAIDEKIERENLAGGKQ
jgi:hypothetical protein